MAHELTPLRATACSTFIIIKAPAHSSHRSSLVFSETLGNQRGIFRTFQLVSAYPSQHAGGTRAFGCQVTGASGLESSTGVRLDKTFSVPIGLSGQPVLPCAASIAQDYLTPVPAWRL